MPPCALLGLVQLGGGVEGGGGEGGGGDGDIAVHDVAVNEPEVKTHALYCPFEHVRRRLRDSLTHAPAGVADSYMVTLPVSVAPCAWLPQPGVHDVAVYDPEVKLQSP